MPAVMTVMSSDSVIRSMNGFTVSGDSIMPVKMFVAAQSVSAPEVRMVRCMTHAAARTKCCMIRR
jgi:hypothetical protein